MARVTGPPGPAPPGHTRPPDQVQVATGPRIADQLPVSPSCSHNLALLSQISPRKIFSSLIHRHRSSGTGGGVDTALDTGHALHGKTTKNDKNKSDCKH